MMINKIRAKITQSVGEKHLFRFNGSRNQIEEFEGVIKNAYPMIFIIDVNGVTRSFSYSDVLLNHLEFLDTKIL